MDTRQTKNLLLVEDEVILAMDKIQRLKKLGYSVIHVTSGKDAIKTVNRDNPPINLILMDIDLGKGMDGTEAAEKILATRDIPILFLSSHTEKEVVEKTEKITSYGYVVKNSGMTVLDASIKMAFKLFDAHHEIHRKNMAIKAGNENLRVTIEKLEEVDATRRQTEKELLLHMERYKRAQKIGLIGDWEFDIRTNTIWGSEEARRIYNLPLSENNVPMEGIELMQHDRKRLGKALADLIQEIHPYDFEFEIQPAGQQKWKWLHSVAELQKDEDGKPVKVVGVIQDISKQKADESALRKLQQAVNNSSDIILMLDKNGTITFMNPRFTEIYGYTAEEVLNKCNPSILSYEPPDTAVKIRFWENLRKTRHLKTEFKNKSKTGRLIYVEDTIDALFDSHGDLTGFLEIQRDITDRKNAEIKLKQSEESLSITLQSIGDAVLAADLSGKITRMNRMAETLTGWKAAEVIGKPLKEVFRIINADSRREVKNPVEKVLSSGAVVNLANHTVLVSREGKEYQIADSAAPIRDVDGTVRGIILVFSDVTEKYNREKDRKRIQGLFEAMFNTIPDGVVITDTQRVIQFANEGIRSTFGYKPAEIIGKKTALLYSENRNYKDTGSSVFNKNVVNSEKRYVTYYKDKSGRTFPGETIGSKLYDNEGTWIGNLGIMRDITMQEKMIADLSEAKEQAEQSKAEKELLMKEVHHRIKNHMSTIRSLLTLQADSSQNRDTIDALKKAEDRVYTMMVLYDKLYRSDNFGSIPVRDYLVTLTNDILNSLSIPPLRIYRDIKIDNFKLDTGRLSVIGIIINELLNNSIKYAFKSKEAGSITVKIYRKNNLVHLSVCDDGPGIPDSAIQSTLPGFGLQLVSTLTAQLNGTVTFEREKGTKVTLEFEYETG